MKVGEGRANRRVHLKSARRSEEFKFWRCKGVGLRQFKHSMIHAPGIFLFHLINAKMEEEIVDSFDDHSCNRVNFKRVLFFLEAERRNIFHSGDYE